MVTIMTYKNIKALLKRKFPILKNVSLCNLRRQSKKEVLVDIGHYESDYLLFSSSLKSPEDRLFLRRDIIISTHILEKGLSHSNYKPGFGKQVVINLQKEIAMYYQFQEKDNFAIDNAISVLNTYHNKNVQYGFDDSNYLVLNKLNRHANSFSLFPRKIEIGVSNNDLITFSAIAKARHSVRLYETKGEKIDNELLHKVISLANTAPSACNRQATHVFAVTNKELFPSIEKIHKGCNGFGVTASAFLFITSDLSLYLSKESKLPIFDNGLFTMNLLYALKVYGIESCVLNATFPGDDSRKIHEVTGIPFSYEINGLVVAYKISTATSCLVASSPRRSSDEILTIL